jgi:LacI family transcriptional regulator
MARGLRSNRSDMIGAVLVDVASPFYAQMVGGIQKGAREKGRFVVAASGYADANEEGRAIVDLIDRACDGLILYLENPLAPDVVEIVRNSRTPVVTIGGDECPVADAAIRIDNFSGAREAMRLLLDGGHRAICYLSGGLKYRDTHERLRGISAALAERGLGLDDISVEHGEFEEAFGFDATLRLIDSGREVTAIMAGDDDVAAGALLALKQAGRRVPEDISLVGFDDNFHARHLTPALTTVRQPVGLAGQVAASLLCGILDGHRPNPSEIVVPADLVLRQSVAGLAAAGPKGESLELSR